VSLAFAPLALLWPGGLLLALADGRRRAAGWSAAAVLAAAVVVLALLLAEVVRDGPVDVVAGGWPADVGIRLSVDALGAVLALVSAVVLLAALVHGVLDGVEQRLFPALTLFLALGLTGLFVTGDAFSFYVFFELAMLASYALASGTGERRQLSGALVFAVVNLLGTFVFLLGIAALYRATGTLEMVEIARRTERIDPNTALLVAVTFFVAFAIKLGLFPFHFWLPAVYGSAPPAVAAMLAGALANIGGYGLLRFGAGLLPRELALGAAVVIAIGIGSIVYGALQAISRRSTPEVLAYSTIADAGYVLVAVGIGGRVGLAAAVLFTLVNALNKTLLFLVVDLRGPLVAACFAMGAFSVAGVPPSAGFFGKAAIINAGVDAGSVAVVALLFVGGALSFVYLFQIYAHDFWQPGSVALPRWAPPLRRVTPAVAAVAVLAIGLWPEPLLAVSERAARDLLEVRAL
jgi:multicomponent Na+:H+ antiporter subunit D